MSEYMPTLSEIVLECGGSGAPNGEAWIWWKDGFAPGDPEAPDTRICSAPPPIAAEMVRRWNAYGELVAALELWQARFDLCNQPQFAGHPFATHDWTNAVDAGRAALDLAGIR